MSKDPCPECGGRMADAGHAIEASPATGETKALYLSQCQGCKHIRVDACRKTQANEERRDQP